MATKGKKGKAIKQKKVYDEVCGEEIDETDIEGGRDDWEIEEPIAWMDGSKCRYDLISPAALRGMAWVLAFGARKHGEQDWLNGELSLKDNLRAAVKHLLAYAEGEEFDGESGLPHIDHALCRLMFASHFYHTVDACVEDLPFKVE